MPAPWRLDRAAQSRWPIGQDVYKQAFPAGSPGLSGRSPRRAGLFASPPLPGSLRRSRAKHCTSGISAPILRATCAIDWRSGGAGIPASCAWPASARASFVFR